MADGKPPKEVDILALIAEVHGGSPEALREERVASALNTLEVTHRGAARALRDLNTEGMRRKRMQMQSAPATPEQKSVAAEPPKLLRDSSPEAAQGPGPDVEVQHGEGAEVDLDHRTLTHIVRPNRGRR